MQQERHVLKISLVQLPTHTKAPVTRRGKFACPRSKHDFSSCGKGHHVPSLSPMLILTLSSVPGFLLNPSLSPMLILTLSSVPSCRWESNPRHLWLEPPVLCHWNTIADPCRGSVAEHWWVKPEVFWVRLPATASLFTFLYFHLAQWQSTGGSSQRCSGFDSQRLPAFSLSSIFVS